MKKQPRRSLLGRTLKQFSNVFASRRRRNQRKDRREAFLFESLESRHLMAGDLDQGEGEGTAPTLAQLPNIVLHSGSPQWVPLDGFDVEGGTLTFTATSNNPGLVGTTIPLTNKSIKMTVAGFGDMHFQLFEHLTPRVTSRIIQLIESGFYDDTATNTITFHRILNDFVIQAGDPTGTGSGGSTLGDFDDQFHVDLQHNRTGLLSMAKSGDDTNDSQFFITEEKNESQFITLAGSPTGGAFTLTYFDQVTPAITFNNSGNFAAMAASIKTALEGLGRIGTGNVTVTHDPVRNAQNQITENRRWRVDFGGTLSHQELVNLTGNANGLTGGSNRSIVIDESKSARHLDFNHSIFGVLTQGESVRDAISNVTTSAQGTPANPPVISNIDVIVDPENGALMLKAPAGAVGETDVTVRVTDAQGNFTERTFHVIVSPDGLDGSPFLNDIGPVRGVSGQPILLNLAAQDVEGGAVFFDAVKPAGTTVQYTLSVNNNSGVVTMTPPAGFVGTFNVQVGVRGAVQSDTGDQFDTQIVSVTVAPPPPVAIDLLSASDSGFSSSDNITNANSLQLQVSGVTNNAFVRIKRGDTIVASGTATGSTINLNVANFHTFGEGVHTLRATQSVGGIESDQSIPLDLTLDTVPPGAFTSTPPTEASVGLPLLYNANAPGEGTAGFVFTLSSAPAGAAINGVTGDVTWTPGPAQVGNHVFQVIATDAAGNATNQTLNLVVDEPLPADIEITLTLTTPSGQPITSLDANQEFVLNAFVRDVRNESQFIRLSGSPTGGTFTLTFNGQTTAAIAFDNAGDFDDMADAIESALQALAGIGAGNVSVTHDPTSGTGGENRRWKVEFVGALGSREVANMTGNATGLTGGTSSAVVVTESNSPAGASSVYMDILFDAARAEAIGAIQFNTPFFMSEAPFAAGDVNTPGLINEAGSVGPLSLPAVPLDPANPNEPFKIRVFSVPMRAKQSGVLTFTADPADDTVAHPTTVYNTNGEVEVEKVRFGTLSVTVDATFGAVNDTFNVNEDVQNHSLNPLANDTIDAGSGNVLTISAVGATNNGGLVQIATDGKSLLYTPAANFFGAETFTYTARNQNNETSVATITVQVQPQNDPPTGVDDTPTVPEDSQNFALDVLSNDLIAPDANETLKVTAVTQPASGGTAAVGPGGNTVTFTPSNNFIGTATFTYTLSDGNGGTDTASVTVNVTEANDNPTAVNDQASVAEESSATTINVLANDSFAPDVGETLTVTAVGAGSQGGTVTIPTGGANVVYTPAANFQGVETFTYTISDGRGGTSNATVTVTVTNSNDPPTSVNDTLNAFKNTAAELNVLANDLSAPDPTETLTIEAVGQPAHGTVAISNNGTRVTYTPANNYTGPDSFTYTIRDPGGAISQSATVNLTVQEFIPSSLAGFVYFDVDNDGTKDGAESPLAGVTITLTGTDINNAAVNRTLKTLANGSYKFDSLAPGSYTITQTQPALTMEGKDTVGSQGGAATTNDKIVITNLAQNTNGINNNFGERGRQKSLITLKDFYASRSRNYALAALDSAGVPLWTSKTGDAFAGLTGTTFSLVNNATQIKVDGTNSQAQPVSATLPITDSRIRLLGNGGTNKLFQVSSFDPANPNPGNVAPVAVNNAFSTNEDTVLSVPVATGVLANDTDANAGTTLTAAVVSQPTKGTLTLNGNGSFTYTPQANATGSDTFTYRASDGVAQSQPATVTITITAVNDAPAAVTDTFTATLNTDLNVNQAGGVLANDTDAEGTTLTATVVAQPQHGTLTFNANGSFLYKPTTGYTGPDSFTYKSSDGSLSSGTATVNITVREANVAPVGAADSFTATEDTPLSITTAAQGVLANDTDANAGTTLSAVVVNQPLHGQLTLNTNGTFTYTPAVNYNGADSFTYRAGDGTLQSEAVTVSLTVTAVNDAPVATADTHTATKNTPRSIAAPGLLSNDTDADGNNTISVVLTPITAPAHGQVTLSANGSFVYTPTTDYVGPDSFTYQITDGTLTSQATVTLTVQEAGGGEGESTASDAALLAFLDGEDDAYSQAGDEGWHDAVDEILTQLA